MNVVNLLAVCAALGCARPVVGTGIGEVAPTDVSVALVLDGGGTVDVAAPKPASAEAASPPKKNRGRGSRRP